MYGCIYIYINMYKYIFITERVLSSAICNIYIYIFIYICVYIFIYFEHLDVAMPQIKCDYQTIGILFKANLIIGDKKA